MLGNPDEPRSLTAPAGIEDLLLFRMSKVIALGGGIVTRICEGRFGITRREWTVLAILARKPTMPWSELALRCEVDDASISRAVSSLVTKGLALRIQQPTRQVAVGLTQQGRQIHDDLFPITCEINAQLLRALDADAIAGLDRALAALHARGESLARETPVPKAERRIGRQK